METSQQQSFLNPTTNLAKDPIPSTIFKQNQDLMINLLQHKSWRDPQINNSTSTSLQHHMGNDSFTEIDYFQSAHFSSTSFSENSSSTLKQTKEGGGVVEEAKTLVDIGKKAAETGKAFGNADKSGLQGSTPQKKPKAEADPGCNRYPIWLSCFPCCTTSYV
ncbi:LOW QUALITY PROTEIN: hypothetical protein YC2023_016037 [Brassica napus]